MSWNPQPREKKCVLCEETYEFFMDTMFIARNGMDTCPKCVAKVRAEQNKKE